MQQKKLKMPNYMLKLNKKKNAAAAFQQANPYKSMGASFAGGALLPLGAAGKANTLVEAMGNAAKVGIPLGAVDAGLRKSGDLGDKIQASVQGGAEGGIGAALFGGAGYGVGRAGAKILPNEYWNALPIAEPNSQRHRNCPGHIKNWCVCWVVKTRTKLLTRRANAVCH